MLLFVFKKIYLGTQFGCRYRSNGSKIRLGTALVWIFVFNETAQLEFGKWINHIIDINFIVTVTTLLKSCAIGRPTTIRGGVY